MKIFSQVLNNGCQYHKSIVEIALRNTLVTLISSLIFLNTVGVDMNTQNWGELSTANSTFTSVDGRSRFEVWGIVQARILKDGSGIGGFCGSAWICRITKEEIIFATAAHIVSRETFYSKENNPDKVFVFLSNASGVSFPITFDNVKIYQELDLAFIKVRKPGNFELKELPSGIVAAVDKKVYNMGFPNRAQKDIHFSIDINIPKATFNKGPWVQSGKIITTVPVTTHTNDVNLSNAKCFRLDYASESGFSGGPLLSQNDNNIIGMMIMVCPTKDGSPPTETIALSVEEINKVLDNLTIYKE